MYRSSIHYSISAALTALVLMAFSVRPSSAAMIKVDENQMGSEIGVNPGDTVVVTLDAQPGSGSSWQVSGIDIAQIKEIGDPVFQPNDKANPQGPGHETFQFAVQSEGRTNLDLRYGKPSATTPERVFTIAIIARVSHF